MGNLYFSDLPDFEVGAFQGDFKTASEPKAPSEITYSLSRYFFLISTAQPLKKYSIYSECNLDILHSTTFLLSR